MREIIQAQLYVPPWKLVYLNTNSNAKQGRPAVQTRNENGPELQRPRDQLHSAKQQAGFKSDNIHTDNFNSSGRVNSAENGFNELNYVLMRENIEKRKRVKILKNVKSTFNDMFTRIQDITDGLKTQLDDAMKEHRKASKMVNSLHNHISGMQDSLDFKYENEAQAFEKNDMELAPPRGRTPRRLILPPIESANSSRPCSLPDIFKVESSDQSPGLEDLRVSRTRQIRKIAEKKSQEMSLIESSNTRRKKAIFEVSREKRTTREINSTQTVNSANSMSSADSVNRTLKRRNKAVDSRCSILLSGSGRNGKELQQIQVRDKSADSSAAKTGNNKQVLEKFPKENSASTIASTSTQKKEVSRKISEKNSVKQTTERTTVSQKYKSTSRLYGTELVNLPNQRKHSNKSDVRQLLPKLKKEEIVKEIRSIEECIIKPNRTRNECAKTFADQEQTQTHGRNRQERNK